MNLPPFKACDPTAPGAAPAQGQILEVVGSLYEVLLEKNRRYGNSALEPVQVFAKQPPGMLIRTRIDDKLSRIKNAGELRRNDVVDILGYLVLLCVAEGWTDFRDLID